MAQTNSYSPSKISFLLSLFIVVTAWIFIHITREWFGAPPEIHPELSSFINPINSMSQRIGHYLIVIFIALAAMGLLVGTRLNLVNPHLIRGDLANYTQSMVERPSYKLVLLLTLVVFSWRWHGNVMPVAGAFALLGLTIYLLKNFRHQSLLYIWLALIIGFAFIHVLMPIFLPLDYSRTALSNIIFLNEMHYSSVLGPAERLAQGGVLFNNVEIKYGLIFPVFISIFGTFELADYFRLQQYSNGIFFLFCFLAYGKKAKWQFHIIFALCLFILPWLNNLPEIIATPNQTGMRYIGISLTLLFLAYQKVLGTTFRSIVAGALSALCLLLNFETGMVISVALFAFIFFTNDVRKFISCLVSYVFFIISAFAIVSIFWFLATQMLENPPRLNSSEAIIGFISLFMGGFGGLKLPLLSLAFIFLTHAGFNIILLTSKWDFRKLKNRQAIKMATSLLIVGWLAYYFNRPEPRNLWIIFVLYGFLLIPLLHKRYFTLPFKNLQTLSIPLPLLAIILFVAPQAVTANLDGFKKTYRFVNKLPRVNSDATEDYSGLTLKSEIANTLKIKAGFLHNLPTDKSVEYMTVFSFSMPIISGRSSFGLAQDVFTETFSKEDHKALFKQLEENGPELLLVDDFSSFNQQELSRWISYYARIRSRIAPFYELESSVDGWHVYKRM